MESRLRNFTEAKKYNRIAQSKSDMQCLFFIVDIFQTDAYNDCSQVLTSIIIRIFYMRLIFRRIFMIMKKVLSVFLSLGIVFSLSSCRSDENDAATKESSTLYEATSTEVVAESIFYTEVTVSDTTSEAYVQQTSRPASTGATVYSTEAGTTTENYDDPANWSKKRIVEEYKKAATKSNSTAKSTQRITIKDISVNDGEHENVMSFITSIIGKFLESNSTEKDGITGGFQNLVPDDVSSAKAYKNGTDTVIEMVMVEQTSGPKEDEFSGSVGHAITAVGDIDKVVKDLSDRGLPLELSEEGTNIYYTNPIVKVSINENGEIINGTWSYTVEISMLNFKAFGQNVDKARIIMDNTITV